MGTDYQGGYADGKGLVINHLEYKQDLKTKTPTKPPLPEMLSLFGVSLEFALSLIKPRSFV